MRSVQRVLIAASAACVAVTAFAGTVGMAYPGPRTSYRIKVVEVVFDRPFGFIAVHRPSGLAVVAGWVASPFTAVR